VPRTVAVDRLEEQIEIEDFHELPARLLAERELAGGLLVLQRRGEAQRFVEVYAGDWRTHRVAGTAIPRTPRWGSLVEAAPQEAVEQLLHRDPTLPCRHAESFQEAGIDIDSGAHG
jgi:hypothetical protein